jgi:hypothetical protein
MWSSGVVTKFWRNTIPPFSGHVILKLFISVLVVTRHFDETQEHIWPLSIPHYQHFPLYVVPDNLSILISC